MSVYKNDAGRAKMAEWYVRFLEKLEHPYHFRSVDTCFGHTNVLCSGDSDAPVLLCLHGAMGSSPAALSQVQSIIPHFRIVFPDTVGQPGRSAETYLPLRGDAYGRWVIDVMDGLQIQRARVLGVSMGGYIALKLAEYAPERVEALSLWVPGGIVNSSPWTGIKLGLMSLVYYLFPNEARIRTIYDQLFTDYDETWFRFLEDSLRYLKMDRRMPQLARDGAFDRLTAPVQVLANEHDWVFPPEALMQRSRVLFPNLVDAGVIPDFKHAPPITPGVTDPVLDRIRDFLLCAGEDGAQAAQASSR